MNSFLKMISLSALLAFSCSATAKSETKQSNTVDTKCFVELVGGGEMISFWNIPSKRLPSLSKSIVGHKVVMTGTNQEVKIYKAHECVLLNDDFSSSRAKLVDSETAR
jgi:hypothetical protein